MSVILLISNEWLIWLINREVLVCIVSPPSKSTNLFIGNYCTRKNKSELRRGERPTRLPWGLPRCFSNPGPGSSLSRRQNLRVRGEHEGRLPPWPQQNLRRFEIESVAPVTPPPGDLSRTPAFGSQQYYGLSRSEMCTRKNRRYTYGTMIDWCLMDLHGLTNDLNIHTGCVWRWSTWASQSCQGYRKKTDPRMQRVGVFFFQLPNDEYHPNQYILFVFSTTIVKTGKKCKPGV